MPYPLIIRDSNFMVQHNSASIVNRRSAFEIMDSLFTGDAQLERTEPVLRCLDCRVNKVSFNTFSHLQVSSVIEGNIDGNEVEETPSIIIESNEFLNIKSSTSGGAIYLNWVGSYSIRHNTFNSIKSEVIGSQGGAIYSSVQSANSVIEINSNSFR